MLVLPHCSATLRACALLMLLVLCAAHVSGLWIVPSNSSVEPEYIQSPRIRFISPKVPYPITGELVYSHDRYPSGNYTGKILLHRAQSWVFFEDVCERLKDSGLKAYILIFNSGSMYPGLSQYGRMRMKEPENPFPAFEITALQNWTQLAKWFATEPDGVFATLHEDDPNPWDRVYQRWLPPLCWILVIASIVICGLAFYKLTLHMKRDGARLNIPQTVLTLNIIACLIRVAHLLVDPMGVYGVYPYWWVQLGVALPWPPTLTSALLITLYWHEMIQQHHRMNQFLDKSFVPFLIFGGVIWAYELITGIIRGLGAVITVIVIIQGLYYAITILGLLIFFIVTKIRVDRVFSKLNMSLNQSSPDQRQKRLKLASNIVITMGVVSAVFLGGLFALGVGMAIGTVFFIPKGYYTIFTILAFSVVTLNALQVLLIRTPKNTCGVKCCDILGDSDSTLKSKSRTSNSKSRTSNSKELTAYTLSE